MKAFQNFASSAGDKASLSELRKAGVSNPLWPCCFWGRSGDHTTVAPPIFFWAGVEVQYDLLGSTAGNAPVLS